MTSLDLLGLVLMVAVQVAPSQQPSLQVTETDRQAASPARSGVEGVVRSSAGDPLPYAHVRVLDGPASDWTDRGGQYQLDGLATGRWRVRFTHPAHDSVELQVLVGDGPLSLDVTLTARPGPAPEPLADFEPFQVAYTLPALLNSGRIARLIQRLYPPDLVEAGAGGEAVLRLWLDERGQVVRGELAGSSGHVALDDIALTVADSMLFRPAKNRDRMVRVIVRIPVVFQVPRPGGDTTADGATSG